MTTISELESNREEFCRLVRARSVEHANAMRVVVAQGLMSVAAGLLRQELDSIV